MISNTKITKRTKKKTDKYLVETIKNAKKENPRLASLLSGSTKKRTKKNLHEINKEAKEKETIIIPGKVLGTGDITKKIEIIALSYSKSALEKLEKAKIKTSYLTEEVKKQKEIKGRILV